MSSTYRSRCSSTDKLAILQWLDRWRLSGEVVIVTVFGRSWACRFNPVSVLCTKLGLTRPAQLAKSILNERKDADVSEGMWFPSTARDGGAMDRRGSQSGLGHGLKDRYFMPGHWSKVSRGREVTLIELGPSALEQKKSLRLRLEQHGGTSPEAYG
jgi:hypothetical protein